MHILICIDIRYKNPDATKELMSDNFILQKNLLVLVPNL